MKNEVEPFAALNTPSKLGSYSAEVVAAADCSGERLKPSLSAISQSKRTHFSLRQERDATAVPAILGFSTSPRCCEPYSHIVLRDALFLLNLSLSSLFYTPITLHLHTCLRACSAMWLSAFLPIAQVADKVRKRALSLVSC